MPPKKKPGSAKSKGKSTASLSGDDKVGKLQNENEVLSKELEIMKELNTRLRNQVAEQKIKIDDMEKQIITQNEDRVELTTDMNRQYKTLESDTNNKVSQLESQISDLKAKLATAQLSLQEAAKEHVRVVGEKDGMIEDLNAKITYISAEFEKMLADTLSKMQSKLDSVQEAWAKEDTNASIVSEVNHKRLADFHLTRLALKQG